MVNPDRVRKYLEKCEPAISGQHGHDTLFRAACALVHGFALDPESACPFLAEYNTRCEPPWSEYDLRRKLAQALTHPGHHKPRGHLLGTEAVEPIAPTGQLPKSEPAWPKPNLATINDIVLAGPGLYDLRERSPFRFEDDKSHAEEIIDVLFPGNPLLCCAKSSERFATRRREVWRGRLSSLPLMVPNPMLAPKGPTQGGWLSEHSKSATARRVYLCIEFDFCEKAKDGVTDTIWAPLIRAWKADSIEIVDACAALIFHLLIRMPTLVSVCFSGGKSLHAWFRVFDIEPTAQRAFMDYAVAHGADRATWNKAQLVRIPDGHRHTGVRQSSHYLDPQEAVHI